MRQIEDGVQAAFASFLIALAFIVVVVFVSVMRSRSVDVGTDHQPQQTDWDSMTQTQKERWCEMDMKTRIKPNLKRMEREQARKHGWD